jgi:hypothetical protein
LCALVLALPQTSLWSQRAKGANQPTTYLLGAGLWDLLYHNSSVALDKAQSLAQALQTRLPGAEQHRAQSSQPWDTDPLNTRSPLWHDAPSCIDVSLTVASAPILSYALRTFVLWKSASALLDSQLSGHRLNNSLFRDASVVALNAAAQQIFADTIKSPVRLLFSVETSCCCFK